MSQRPSPLYYWAESIAVATSGRGLYRVDAQVNEQIGQSGLVCGTCLVFCKHTSASLVITENADPAVHRDLEGFMARLVRDGDPQFEHTEEGPDDMSGHIRSVLTQPSISLPFDKGELSLGVWQGLYLYEHRFARSGRTLQVSLTGCLAAPS